MMDKQLEMALAKLLEKASSGIDSASVFLQAQIPDVVHQFLMWRLWESVIANIIAICFFVISWRFLLASKNFGNSSDNEDLAIVGKVVVSVVLIFISFKVANIDFIQILVAPKVYLIEHAAKIIKP